MAKTAKEQNERAVRAARARSMHLTIDMIGIVDSLAHGPVAADNFIRSALAVLASRGVVNIVDGMASLSAVIGIEMLARVLSDENQATLNARLDAAFARMV